ncbi:unnamed protein product [Closterium sp. NIES-64]|nr:unnamed protein product [Closterium sp. NIES-64]
MPRAASELLNGSYFGSRSARESLPTLSTQSSSLSDRSLSTRSEPALSSGGEMAELEHQSSAGGKAQAGGEAEGGKTAQQKQQWGAWHAQVQQLWGSSSQLLARYTSGGKVASLENNCAMQSAWNPVGAQGESDRPQHVVIYICESIDTSKPLQAAAGEERSLRKEERVEGREAEGERDAGGRVGEEKLPNQARAEVAEQQKKEADKEEKREEEVKEGKEESEEGDDEDPEVEAGFKMSRVCDRLVDVFWVEKPDPAQWRLLLAFSAEWARIRPHFFARAKLRAREFEEQGKPDKAAELYRLARRLKEVDDSMTAHNELFSLVEEHEAEGALEGLVARRRRDFTGEFFEHLQILCHTNRDHPQRQDEIASLAAKCVTAVDIHDKVEADEVAVEAAQAKFDDIMGSASLAEACGKIDQLAARQQLDSTLMLMITKAWAAAKESNMMKDEVKDIMYHLYKQAQINMRMLVPKEVRILRHVLAIDDPRQQLTELTNAFSPGGELEVQNASEDMLYTTPEKLLEVIEQVLDAYYAQRRQQSSLIDEAKKLMNPAVIARMEVLKDMIVDQFM